MIAGEMQGTQAQGGDCLLVQKDSLLPTPRELAAVPEREPVDLDAAISIRGLEKRYGEFTAVDGLDLDIRRGEIFALLGPNGAGKTTTVEICEGYRKPDAGEVRVLGQDPADGGRAWKAQLGIVLQSGAGDSQLTCREMLQAQASYYPDPRDADEVLALVGLTEKAKSRGRTLSGGQRRRLDVALGIIGRPTLLFLDEPTTGFDPAARRAAWELIRALRALGTTILLTTHYLDEAQQLADRVAVLRDGLIVRQGSPADLIGDTRTTEIRYVQNGEVVIVSTTEPTRALNELTAEALATGQELERLEVRRPTLEDVYLELVGEESE